MKSHDAPSATRPTITRGKAKRQRLGETIDQPHDRAHALASAGPDKIAYLAARPLAFSDPAWAHQQPCSSFELSYPDYPDPAEQRALPPFGASRLARLARLDHLDRAAAPRRAALLQVQDIAESVALINEAHGLIDRRVSSKRETAFGAAGPGQERLADPCRPKRDSMESFSQSSISRSAASFDMDVVGHKDRPAKSRLGSKPAKHKRRHGQAKLSAAKTLAANIA